MEKRFRNLEKEIKKTVHDPNFLKHKWLNLLEERQIIARDYSLASNIKIFLPLLGEFGVIKTPSYGANGSRFSLFCCRPKRCSFYSLPKEIKEKINSCPN